jgi:hypothetical protein
MSRCGKCLWTSVTAEEGSVSQGARGDGSREARTGRDQGEECELKPDVVEDGRPQFPQAPGAAEHIVRRQVVSCPIVAQLHSLGAFLDACGQGEEGASVARSGVASAKGYVSTATDARLELRLCRCLLNAFSSCPLLCALSSLYALQAKAASLLHDLMCWKTAPTAFGLTINALPSTLPWPHSSCSRDWLHSVVWAMDPAPL